MIRLISILLFSFYIHSAKAFENIKINFGNYSLNKYEITIEEFIRYAKKNNKLVSLSEQNLVDCSDNFGNEGCMGGWPSSAMDYVIKNKGIDTEDSYSYQGIDENCKYNKTYQLGINNFTDVSKEEFKSIYLKGLQSKNIPSQKEYHKFDNSHIPHSIDWRADGLVTNIKDQGQCGSCWAFSAVGTMEGQHAKKNNKLVSLSEQNLVDCSNNFGNEGCMGGWPSSAMDYVIKNKGIDTEDSYSYEGIDESCKYNKTYKGATISNVVFAFCSCSFFDFFLFGYR